MKPIQLDISNLDGNAFLLMATFRKAALKQGRSKEEVNQVLEEFRSSDYDHLLQTLIKYTTGAEE